MNAVVGNIKSHIDPNFSPDKSLDFGYGVGRLFIPISKFPSNVVGVDISQSMLDEAKLNCGKMNIRNPDFLQSVDNIMELGSSFDFIHSFIVFQHIPAKRGLPLFKTPLHLQKEGGICVVHFTYAKTRWYFNPAYWIIKHIPLVKYLINLIKRRSLSEPQAQMNDYNLNKLFKII